MPMDVPPARRARALTIVCACLALVAGVASGQSLNLATSQLIENAGIGEDATVGVSAIEVGSGRVLIDVAGGDRFIPASNMKVLTVGAAMSYLGPDYVFRTTVEHDGERLIVRGSGDPALGDPELLSRLEPALTIEQLLTALASGVRDRGVSSVSEIIVDDRVFDREYVHPAWPRDQLNRRYCAEVAGVNVHANVISVYARPDRGVGAPPSVEWQPASPWVQMQVKARTTSKGRNGIWLSRLSDENRFTLHGQIAHPTQVPVEVTLHDAPLFFGRLLADRLDDAGVRVANGQAAGSAPSGVRLAHDRETLPEGDVIAAITTPMSDIASQCLVESDNLYAESLCKLLGYRITGEPGSWENGAAVIRMAVTERLGPDAASDVVVSDGSGLSDMNRVSPSTLTRWLASVRQDERIGEAFLAAMPAVGEGTLERRFQKVNVDSQVRAKSGYINRRPGEGAVCLTGYVVHNDTGRTVAFAVLVNNVATGNQIRAAKLLHERIVSEIDDWLVSQSAAIGG